MEVSEASMLTPWASGGSIFTEVLLQILLPSPNRVLCHYFRTVTSPPYPLPLLEEVQ